MKKNCCSSDACSVDEQASKQDQVLCPLCGQKGLKVKSITLKSLLKPENDLNQPLDGFRFCRTQACPVAYFNSENRLFKQDQVKVPIYQKDLSAAVKVCYCFEVDRGDVATSVERGEGMKIHDEIKQRKAVEGCECESLNPQGACCFGNVKALILELQKSKA